MDGCWDDGGGCDVMVVKTVNCIHIYYADAVLDIPSNMKNNKIPKAARCINHAYMIFP